MEAAISSSVTSTLKLSAPTTTLHSNFKTPNLHPHNHNHHNRSRRNSITTSSRRSSFTHTATATATATTTTTTTTTTSRSASSFHERASTGYAAALVDIAQCNNALPRVESDVRRLSRLLRKALQHPEANERVVKNMVEGGRFSKPLVGLVNMLLLNKGLGLVVEVMEEFHRIYDQLAGTTSTSLGLQGGFSGAAKVKLNNLVAPHPSSFAH